jgi:hypothetical protein
MQLRQWPVAEVSINHLMPIKANEAAGDILRRAGHIQSVEDDMHELIYLIGLIVVIMFILGLLGLR